MKNNTKSSITLPPKELQLVRDLQKKIGAKSKVEVIRQGLMKLKEITDREMLRAAYGKASQTSRGSTHEGIRQLDHLSDEGLDNE